MVVAVINLLFIFVQVTNRHELVCILCSGLLWPARGVVAASAVVCFILGEVRCSGGEAARGTSVRLRKGACSARAAGEGPNPPRPTPPPSSLHSPSITTSTITKILFSSNLFTLTSKEGSVLQGIPARPQQHLPPRPPVHGPHSADVGKFGNFCPLCCRSWKECAGVQVVKWGKGGAGGLR